LLFGNQIYSREVISKIYLYLKANSENNFAFAAFVYFILYLMVVSLSLPIATVLTLIGGAIFEWNAIVIIVFAATLGATTTFIIAKYISGDYLIKKFDVKFEGIKKGLSIDSFYYLFFIRLVPIAPFFIVNIAAGILNMRTLPYIFATFFGIMPGVCIYVWFGRSIGSVLSKGEIPNTDELFWYFLPKLIILGFFVLIPVIFRKFKHLY
jgi:uncharacterized membrane protein YdjX (TVP38/TMEM64 family)